MPKKYIVDSGMEYDSFREAQEAAETFAKMHRAKFRIGRVVATVAAEEPVVIMDYAEGVERDKL